MHRKLLTNLTFLLITISCTAQVRPVDPEWHRKNKHAPVRVREYVRKPALVNTDTGTIYFRTVPSTLLDPMDMYISLGAEYRFNKNFSVTMDAGYIFLSAYYGNTKATNGMVLRPAARVYLGKRKKWFTDLQLHYKNVTYQVKDWLGRMPVNNVSSYQEYKRFRINKTVLGQHLLLGVRDRISTSNRWYIEVYIGMGVQQRWSKLPGEPNSQYNGRDEFLGTSTNTTIIPVLPCGVRVIYTFK
jgi:hypothetical protein